MTSVRFAPGAAEPVHTHPYDIIVVPIDAAAVTWTVGDVEITELAAGEVQFVPAQVPHTLANRGEYPFEVIAIAVK